MTPEKQAWKNMLQRCNNPKHPRWRDWGGRGISVCAAWLQFEAFYIDMAPRPPGLMLERIDNDGPYEPLNCRWATRAEQQSNQRKRIGASSRYKGVCWRPELAKWQAAIKVKGRCGYLGCFDDEWAASAAFDAARKKHFG